MDSALVGVDDDIDSLCRPDDAFDQVTPQPAPGSLPQTVADKDLRDAFLARELQDGIGRIQAGENLHVRAQLACIVEILLQDGSVVLRKGRLMHIDDIKFALEAVRISSTALQHLRGARSGRDADENALLYAPGRIHAVRPQAALQPAVDYACGDEQRQLPQAGKSMFLREPRGAVFGGASVREAIDGRSIHDHDLVRASIQKPARNRAGGALAGDVFHFILALFEILQVDGGVDGDPGIEHLLDVLPAMTVWTAGGIVIGKTIDERDLGGPMVYRWNINYFVASHFQHRNNLELLQYGLHFRRVLRLQRADDHVLAPLPPAAALVQPFGRFC